MSLRIRLTLIVVLVAAVSLASAGLFVRSYISNFLTERIDRSADAFFSVLDSSPSIVRTPPQGQLPQSQATGGPFGVGTGLYLQIRSADGTVVENFENSNNSTLSKPDLDAVDWSATARTRRFEIPSVAKTNPARYRVSIRTVNSASGPAIVLFASPTTERDTTIARLDRVELLAALAVLLLASGASLMLVRRGLRPLQRIEESAAIIAGGDLSHRVEGEAGPAETVRLGRALNQMMAQIENAFAAKEASQQQLQQFVADASHELRTPLTSIRGHAELARRNLSEDDLSRSMWRVEREAQRMSRLVDDLLLLATFDVEAPLEWQAVSLDGVARDVVVDAVAADPMRKITLDAAARVTVRGDRARLAQVLVNLVANARAHTDKESTITVRVRHDGHDALVEVIDEGPGLTPDVAAHVFDRFFRADPARARDRGGAGLGLPIVRSLVNAHGGTVGVHSVPGKGATFWVRLPAP